MKRWYKAPDLAGQRFGKLLVLQRVSEPVARHVKYLCRCDCGTEKVVGADNLRRVMVTSCGCYRKRSGEASPHWAGRGQLSKRYWTIISRGARVRGFSVGVTIEEVWDLFVKQGGCCALSGLPIQFAESAAQRNNMTASLDRIDSTRGYVAGNIQWVHKDINKMKNSYSQDRFVEVCLAVAAQQGNVLCSSV